MLESCELLRDVINFAFKEHSLSTHDCCELLQDVICAALDEHILSMHCSFANLKATGSLEVSGNELCRKFLTSVYYAPEHCWPCSVIIGGLPLHGCFSVVPNCFHFVTVTQLCYRHNTTHTHTHIHTSRAGVCREVMDYFQCDYTTKIVLLHLSSSSVPSPGVTEICRAWLGNWSQLLCQTLPSELISPPLPL